MADCESIAKRAFARQRLLFGSRCDRGSGTDRTRGRSSTPVILSKGCGHCAAHSSSAFAEEGTGDVGAR